MNDSKWTFVLRYQAKFELRSPYWVFFIISSDKAMTVLKFRVFFLE